MNFTTHLLISLAITGIICYKMLSKNKTIEECQIRNKALVQSIVELKTPGNR